MPRKKVNSAEEPQQDVTEMEQSGMEAPALLENPCRDTDGPGADPSAELDEPDDGLSTPEDGPHLPGEDAPEVHGGGRIRAPGPAGRWPGGLAAHGAALCRAGWGFAYGRAGR